MIAGRRRVRPGRLGADLRGRPELLSPYTKAVDHSGEGIPLLEAIRAERCRQVAAKRRYVR